MARESAGRIKREKAEQRYNDLLQQGLTEEQAERVAKAPAKKTARHGGKHSEYQGWDKRALAKRAQELQVSGRSGMNKQQLINAIRRLEALIEPGEQEGDGEDQSPPDS